ncbi:hypothetical protein, partial [uncultured Bifidobacterium sp.]|uniref:hypothetical protein n=1 Tax=uncultured Bifidobacterium sp. TaxID=165187 RepID=UPI002603270D
MPGTQRDADHVPEMENPAASRANVQNMQKPKHAKRSNLGRRPDSLRPALLQFHGARVQLVVFALLRDELVMRAAL